MTDQRGFTLIELLIVIGIIAILAAAIIIAVAPGDQMERAQRASVESQMQSIGTAVHNVVLDMDPDSPETIAAAVTACTDGNNIAVIGTEGEEETYYWNTTSDEIKEGEINHGGCLTELELPAMTHPVSSVYDYAILEDDGRVEVIDLSERVEPISY